MWRRGPPRLAWETDTGGSWTPPQISSLHRPDRVLVRTSRSASSPLHSSSAARDGRPATAGRANGSTMEHPCQDRCRSGAARQGQRHDRIAGQETASASSGVNSPNERLVWMNSTRMPSGSIMYTARPPVLGPIVGVTGGAHRRHALGHQLGVEPIAVVGEERDVGGPRVRRAGVHGRLLDVAVLQDLQEHARCPGIRRIAAWMSASG